MEIGLPSEAGRLQIFKIHTAKMKANGKIGADVNLEVILIYFLILPFFSISILNLCYYASIINNRYIFMLFLFLF